MASTSSSTAGTYFLESIKISIGALKVVSNDLPVPASVIVELISAAIAALETMKGNREQCSQLRDRLLRLLPVVLMAIKEGRRGKRSPAATPNDLKQSIERLRKDLETILGEVEKIKNTVKSKRFRRKVAALFFGNAHAAALQKCASDLDWAIKEFNVTSRLGDAVRLCEVLEKTRSIHTNQLLHALPRAKLAGFDSERPDNPSNCFEGTRTGILNDIMEWVANQDPNVQRIFWLSGIAGVGKTTVVRTVAQRARDDGILGAQFFFSRRGEAELRNPSLVFSTIAYQLAQFDPEFADRIIAALEAEPDAAFGSLKDQLEKLIIEPLSHVERDPGRVVVIVFDAFDECEATGAKQILQLLINAIPRLPFYLKILLTSRPEPHIHSVLFPSNNLHITALHDIETSIVANDILLYLRHRLRSLPKEIGIDLPEDWITDAEIEMLADKAGNLFIHAATSLRFLSESFDLRAQLDVLLNIITNRRSSRGDTPFADLDELYLEILRGLVTRRNTAEVTRLFQPVLGSIVLLRDPLPIDALERLIGLGNSNITHFLAHLSSVILPPTPSDPRPRIYHPSFPDFLQDATRCTDDRFWINTKDHEVRMALRCLNLIDTALKKGMLGELDPALLDSELADRDRKVQATFSPELQYACCYWAVHFLAAMEGEVDNAVVEALDCFVTKSLVPWLEAMSWLGDLRLCLTSLENVNSWAAKSACSPLTKGLLNDAHRTVLAHFPTINADPQDISRSTFPFLPRNCCLLTQYPAYTNPAITALSGVDPEWPACMTVLKSQSDTVRSVAFSPDGSQLASASDDKTVHIRDARGGDSVVTLRGHTALILDIAYSPDGSRLASASDDKTIRIWDPIGGGCISMLEGHSGGVKCVSYSADGSRLASGSADTTVRIWDLSTSHCVVALQGHSKWVCSVTFSPDGSQVASGSYDQTIRIWNIATTACLTTLRGHSDDLSALIFFSNGSKLASGSDDKTVRLWDVASGSCIVTLEGHSREVYSLAISPDGRYLASGSRDYAVRVWDTTSHTCLTTLTGHSNAVHSVSFSPDGSRLASGSGDATVRIWDTSITGSPASVQGHSPGLFIKSVTFSPDGLRVASGSNDKTVRLWDAETGGVLATLEGHTGWVETVAFSPDSLQLASGSDDNTVRLWDVKTKNCRAILEGHSDCIRSVAFSPDRFRLASGSDDKTIRIWNTITEECLALLRGHSYFVLAVSFSPDGSRLVSGDGDGAVKVWDAVTETCGMTLNGHSSAIELVMFSPSGSKIISRSDNGDVRVRDAKTGAEIDPKAYEILTLTGRQLEFRGGRLSQVDVSGSKRLICIVPVSYVVNPLYSSTRAVFFDLGPDRARVALGCEDGTVLILEVTLC